MTEPDRNDEQLLIDFVLARCDDDASAEVRLRLERDSAFQRRHRDIAAALAALEKLPDAQAPDDLVNRTLERIRRSRQSERRFERDQSRRRGFRPTFSLRELGGVAAAMILLAAIFIPSMHRARELSVINRCASNQGRIGNALLTYANVNDGFLPGAEATTAHWLATGGERPVSNSAGLFRLVRNNYETPQVFQCPAVGGRSFVYRVDMTDFPDGRFVQYSYQHMLGGPAMQLRSPEISAVTEQMAILADSTPVFDGGRFHRDRVSDVAGDNHHKSGQNVLYLSGHVAWSTTPSAGVGGNNIFLIDGVLDYKGDEKPLDKTDTFLLPAYSR